MIDISGLNKADVLAVLYNRSRPQGMGFLAYDEASMMREQAEELLQDSCRFDYLSGRVMKINLKDDDSFDERLYDRDNGIGSAQSAIDELRKSGVESDEIKKAHKVGVEQAAALTYNRLHQETRVSGGVVELGLSDVKDELKPAIDRAKKSVS